MLADWAAVYGNTAVAGGGLYNYNNSGTVGACDETGVGQWFGTVEPNTPNDFLDADVPLITCV
jgi:hypothetical protein